jgi:glycosyltransferase involved in cell wall biosynthesis
MLDQPRPTVSIIIKALNEERHIASAIESALAALDGRDGEVILADSASSDRTVDIARDYPIRIVRLNDVADRSCGAGAQLGFQYSRGHYVLLIDGDMRLREGFLSAAIRFLEENPMAAGVGGIIHERETENIEFAQRTQRDDPDRRPGTVTRLDCGGLYRRSALDSVGYFTDRNLHGGEELDLGARLRVQGWTLARIDCPAIDHFGHSGSAWRLLAKRVATRFAFATGELLRAAVGRPHFWLIFQHNNDYVLCVLVYGWWLSILAAPFLASGATAVALAFALLLFPVAVMSARWRSIRNGLYSVAVWNVSAIGFLPGFLRPRVDPAAWIPSTVVQEDALPVGAPAFGDSHRSAARSLA